VGPFVFSPALVGLADRELQWLVVTVNHAGSGVGTNRFVAEFADNSRVNFHRIANGATLNRLDDVANANRVIVVQVLPDLRQTLVDLVFEAGFGDRRCV
jgi:hypothetical protein